ncbi:MAG: hypothetical protein CMJ34_08715 [Phycisphaerae bacterium]|nr:hypothetical protein [Phycisphaerae bacterium]
MALSGLVALSASTAEARTQDSEETPDRDPGTPVRRVVVPEGMDTGDRAPLLREGGLFIKVPGSIRRDDGLGVLVFEPSSAEGSGLRRELILLPSRGLEDLDRQQRTVDGDVMKVSRYEISGQVLVYRGRNFLLPEAIFPVEDIGSSSASPRPEQDGEDEAASPPTEEEIDRIGEELERRLEARIGSVPRSLDVLEASPARGGAIPTGTRFVDRRGRLSRDPASGVWRFVLSGDGGGAAASVVLLPCLELERIERAARQQDIVRPRLISGTVTNFRGRSYLLPTISRPAIEGRGLGY